MAGVTRHSELSYQFQYREYSEVLYLALKDDAFYSTIQNIVAGSVEGREAVLKYLDYSIYEGDKYGEIYCPPEINYGISVWSKSLSSKLETVKRREQSEFIRKHIGARYEKKYRLITRFVSKQSDLAVDTDAWYLSIVGVLPSFQNRGLGVKLIESVLDKANSIGVSTYFETFTTSSWHIDSASAENIPIGRYLD